MSRVVGAALLGVDGVAVEVEVRISAQLPRIDIVGLPELSVRESAARVRAAVSAIGERFPQNRITVNLAPAALRKGGSGLDLAVAIGILIEGGSLESQAADRIGFVGELALDGRLRSVPGALAMTLAVRDAGCSQVIAPWPCAVSASLAPDIEVLAAPDLGAVVGHLRGLSALTAPVAPTAPDQPDRAPCLSDVRGQENAKRALEIAAAGGHGILFFGPPGSGKTMLARRFPGLLPALNREEALAVTRIHGAADILPPGQFAIFNRPFRAPHHTSTVAGLLGGGSPPTPGEASLAHGGVLFLDELPEFERRAREALRQVLEDRYIMLARAGHRCNFPADFSLVATSNPCPCGWYGSESRDCRCDARAIERYRQRISGPLLDRIDLHVRVPAQPWSKLSQPSAGESSASARIRVVEARKRQQLRGHPSNARIPDVDLDDCLAMTEEAVVLLGHAVDRLHLSARAARRIQRVSRTIADLGSEERVDSTALAEALGYRGEHVEGNSS